MSDNVISLKKEKEAGVSQKMEKFLSKERVALLCVFIVLVLGVAGFCVYSIIKDSTLKKELNAIYLIEKEYVANSEDLSEEDTVKKQGAALEALLPYVSKKGIVGARSNLLAGDIALAKQDFANALTYYVQAADADKKSYIAPLGYYNAGVVSEELGKNEEAAGYYQAAADYADFVNATHALFNIARIKETSGDTAGAKEVYQKIVDSYSEINDEWVKLSNTKLITLE